MFKKDIENGKRFYICLFGKRFIFDRRMNKAYRGWYRA